MPSIGHLLAIISDAKAVASGTKVRQDGTMRREEELRVACRRESPHGPLALARRLVGVRSPVIERAVRRCSTRMRLSLATRSAPVPHS
jgi:hypothetical protein